MVITQFVRANALRILFPVTLAVLVVLAYSYNLLLFHALAELFTIFVAAMTGVVAWHTYRYSHNNYLMYLGLGYTFVGFIDLLHVLAFEGMPTLMFSGTNTSTQFWVAGRLLEVFILVSAPLFLTRHIRRRVPMALFATFTALLCWLIVTGQFPQTYENGVGLTAFKINVEYAIIVGLIVATVFLWRRRALLEPSILRLMLASVILTAFAEATFTDYVRLDDLSLMAGHIFKFFSFWLVFLAVIETTLTRPFHAMAQNASTYDAIPDAIALVDGKGIIRQVNQAACASAHRPRDALIGSHCHDIFHGHEISSKECTICQAIAAGEHVFSWEIKLSENRWGSFSLSPIEALDERPGMVHVFRDVTERNRAEEALRQAHDDLELRVRERTKDLLAANERLQAEIIEREQVQEALIVAKDEAEAANRAKSDFLSRMSHELRTPLNAVLGFAQLLKADKDISSSEILADNVEQILRAGWHLLNLIDEVLDLAKIESGRLNVMVGGVSVERVLAECLELSHVTAKPRKISLHCDLEAIKDMCVSADHIRLKQVLINLISNAIKYNVEHGQVTIVVEKTAYNMVRITVTDTGPGISRECLSELFQPFNRLGAERTEIEGTGIGLVICKRLMELMGGSISAESEVGKGTSFHVELCQAECESFIDAPEFGT